MFFTNIYFLISASLERRLQTHLFDYMNSHTIKIVTANQNEFPEEFKCPTCTKVYKSQSGLYTHRHYECGIDPQFRCFECPYKTHHKHSLKRHYRLKHNLTVAVSTTTGVVTH